jgi:hypothetical protein
VLVVLSVCHKDVDQSRQLLEWIRELDEPSTRHDLLLVASLKVEMPQVVGLLALGKKAFPRAEAIRLREEDPRGWPCAPGQMFQQAVQWVTMKTRPYFMWIESDCAPIAPGWIDTLETEYRRAGKPFFGTTYDRPYPHLNGVAVYPANIHRYNPYMLNGSALPWDVIRPNLTLAHAHVTHLMQRLLADPEHNIPMTFPTIESLDQIRKGAIFFHGCKDMSLIQRLRDREAEARMPDVPKPPKHQLVARKIKALLRGYSTYYHSGNLGDLIYALNANNAAGGGEVLVGPEQKDTAPCMVPINRDQFEMLLPLLKVQPYLRNAAFRPTYPKFVHDMNRFRNFWINPLIKKKHGINTLCKAHFYETGQMHRYHDDEPWLTVPEPLKTNRIIVHRSPRYNAPPSGPQAFPWARLIKDHGQDMMFVGLETEHEKFQSDFSAKVSFWKVKSFLEMAQLIAGAKACFMNQSFPLSLAIGMGQRVFAEELPRSPDCVFKRPTYKGQLTSGQEAIRL